MIHQPTATPSEPATVPESAPSHDPAIIHFCAWRDFYFTCGIGSGVFIAPNRVLTAHHVVVPPVQAVDADSVEGVLFFRDPHHPYHKIPFRRIVVISARDDIAVLEVSDYLSESFHPLIEGEPREQISSVTDIARLEGFPRGNEGRFVSLSVSIIDPAEYYPDHRLMRNCLRVGIPESYDLRGMSGGPLLIGDRMVGILSQADDLYAFVAPVDEHSISQYEPCDDDGSCIRKALRALEEEAQSGDPVAQYLLHEKYHEGIGVERNNEKALYWLEQAISNSESDAAF